MSWFVVNFEKENAVEVVPSKWFIQSSSECFWPPNNLSRWKIAEAIKSRLDPESNWLQHKSIKLGSYNDFKTADHKAKKAQKTNILSSGTEDHIVSQKRKVIKSRRYSSSSAKPPSSDSDSEGIVNPSSGTLSAVFQKDCSLETQEDKENTDELKATEKSFEGIRDVQQSIAITNNGHETQSSDFERNVLRELSWINTKLNMIIDNLNSYNRLEKISNDDEPPTEVLSNLPVNNEEALFQLENYLNGSEANIILMAKELSKIGGTKVKDLLRRIMYRVISNEMGMLYSWDGAKGKKPLKQLALSRVIIRAVRFNRPTASASETEIVDLVRLWLVRCKDRANKQKKDNQEKTEN